MGREYREYREIVNIREGISIREVYYFSVLSVLSPFLARKRRFQHAVGKRRLQILKKKRSMTVEKFVGCRQRSMLLKSIRPWGVAHMDNGGFIRRYGM